MNLKKAGKLKVLFFDVGLRRSGESLGLEVIHDHLREQRGSGAASGVAESAWSLRIPYNCQTIERRLRLQVGNRFGFIYRLKYISLAVFQTVAQANKKFRRIPHSPRLLHRTDLRRPKTGAANWDDERLSQLSDHVSGV